MDSFLATDKIKLEQGVDSIEINVNDEGVDREYFSEGVRIKDVNKTYRFSHVKIQFNIAAYSNWPILLDECLRFAADEAQFSFYFQDSKFVARHVCIGFLIRLFHRQKIKFKLIHLGPEPIGELYIFEIKRQRDLAIKKDWSMGILVDGKAPDMLDKFLSSVNREFSNTASDQKLEVIINGPKTKEYEDILAKYSMDVRFIHTGHEFNHLGWITQKKNAIVAESKFDNVALFHNRYVLQVGWLSRFDEFGYDFELISLKQTYKKERFPDWVAAGSRWSVAKSFLLNPNDFHPNIYVNGGVIVAKKRVLQQIPLNESLFWNHAEDLEHTSMAMGHGILPRYASGPSLDVLNMRKDFMSGFQSPNRLFQKVFGYDFRVSHYSPLYTSKRRILNLLHKILRKLKI